MKSCQANSLLTKKFHLTTVQRLLASGHPIFKKERMLEVTYILDIFYTQWIVLDYWDNSDNWWKTSCASEDWQWQSMNSISTFHRLVLTRQCVSRSQKNKIDRVYMKRQFVRKLWGEIFEMTSNALPFSGKKSILFIYPGRFILREPSQITFALRGG